MRQDRFTELRLRAEGSRSERVRRETAKRCYRIPGYVRLSQPEKNEIYDKVRAEVITELKGAMR